MRPLDSRGYVAPARGSSPGLRRRSGRALLPPAPCLLRRTATCSRGLWHGDDHGPGDGDSRRNTGGAKLPTAMAGHGMPRASAVAEVGGFGGTTVQNQHYALTSRLQGRSAARWQEPHDLDPQVVGDNGPCVIPLPTTATRIVQDAKRWFNRPTTRTSTSRSHPPQRRWRQAHQWHTRHAKQTIPTANQPFEH